MWFDTRAAECYQLPRMPFRVRALRFDDLIAQPVWLPPRARHCRGLAPRSQHVPRTSIRTPTTASSAWWRRPGAGNISWWDDDQSIYGFRGADLSNVLDFESAFPGATLIRLEQNYRSTGNILAAANAVIANNQSRKGKTLWCERAAGAPLQFVLARDDVDEANRVASFVEARARRAGGRLADCAVLTARMLSRARSRPEFRRRALVPAGGWRVAPPAAYS
jgi:hypothetical protein